VGKINNEEEGMEVLLRIAVSKKIILLMVGLVLSASFALPAMSLPPEMEADRLLLSAETKLDKKDYGAAGLDLEKIRALNIKLPVDYYYQYGRYLGISRQAAEAKKNLEIYLDKAGKEGKYYDSALKWYTYLEENEDKWSEENKAAEARAARFKDNGDGTVTDLQTDLMWAAKDNGYNISWADAKAYCENYTAGGYSDWRLPTQDELVGLYDKNINTKFHIISIINLTGSDQWASETKSTPMAAEAAYFNFQVGKGFWTYQTYVYRALPVRRGK
jgi:hypothetical protein